MAFTKNNRSVGFVSLHPGRALCNETSDAKSMCRSILYVLTRTVNVLFEVKVEFCNVTDITVYVCLVVLWRRSQPGMVYAAEQPTASHLCMTADLLLRWSTVLRCRRLATLLLSWASLSRRVRCSCQARWFQNKVGKAYDLPQPGCEQTSRCEEVGVLHVTAGERLRLFAAGLWVSTVVADGAEDESGVVMMGTSLRSVSCSQPHRTEGDIPISRVH